MKREITIQYNWEALDGEFKKHHIEALEESALERIGSQMSEGVTSGQLYDNIFILYTDLNEDGDEGISYTGWWSSTIK